MALIKGKQLADSTIVASKIANNAISTNKIADSSITPAKLNTGSGQTYDFSSATLRAATPSASSDVATKAYVDANSSTGLEVKQSVRLLDNNSQFSNFAYSNGVLGESSPSLSSLSVDGVEPALNDRILIIGRGAADQNGIYTLSQIGNGSSTAFELTRATDFDSSSDISANNFFFVEEGTTYGDTGWVLTADEEITLDSDDLTFQQFSGAGQITAGNGIQKTGNTLSVKVQSNRGLVATSSGIAFDFVNELSSAGTLSAISTEIAVNNSGYQRATPAQVVKSVLTSANGFTQSQSTGLTSLVLSSTGGLELSSSAFKVKLDGDSLASASNGLSVKRNSENSIGLTTSGLVSPILRTDRMSLTPSAVSGSTAASTGAAIPSGVTIADGSAVQVFVNGIKAKLGASTTTSQCFFSADSGSSAKALDSIDAADVLFWNASATGSYDLETTDVLDIVYASLTA